MMYCYDGTKLLRSVYKWCLYIDIFQYPEFRHIVFNGHLLVFVGHLVVAVYPVAVVGCGLALLGTIQELRSKECRKFRSVNIQRNCIVAILPHLDTYLYYPDTSINWTLLLSAGADPGGGGFQGFHGTPLLKSLSHSKCSNRAVKRDSLIEQSQ